MNKNMFITFFMLLFSLGSISASCSLGANPLSMEASAKPGQEVVGTWNLYNLYGDRTTHIIIEKIEGPDWKITFDPSLHEASYDVSGEIQTINENVALEESSVVLEIPENPLKGVAYVKHPNQEGYIPVKPINIYITIPKDAKIGQNYEFVFEAKGNCFTGPGAVIPGVSTQLNFNIKPTTEFYERPIINDGDIKEKNETEKAPETPGLVEITGGVIGAKIFTTGGILTLTTLILLVVILILVFVVKKQKLSKK